MSERPSYFESTLNEDQRTGIGGFMHRHRWAIGTAAAIGFGALIFF